MIEDGIPKMKTVVFFMTALCAVCSTNVLAGWQVSTSSAQSNTGAHVIPHKEPAPLPRKKVHHGQPFVSFKDSEPSSLAPVSHKRTYRAHLKNTEGVPAFSNESASLGRPSPVYAVSISGSLKENLERIMHRYHWKVVWKAPDDYNFDGRVTGTSLPNVVEKLLQPFPLQAVMYMSNRTLAIVPRTTRA